MSRKAAFVLFALSAFFAGAGAQPSGCAASQFLDQVNNGLATRLSAGSGTIYTGESVTFTATVTDEQPDQPFTAARYDWSVDGELRTTTTVNQAALSFDVAGRHSVEVVIEGNRTSTRPSPSGGTVTSDYGTVRDSAALYVNVEDAPDGSTSSGSGEDETQTPTVSVSISGPDELLVGGTGIYLASGTGAYLHFTWDLLGTAATLNSTSGSSTSVTGASIGTVTLVVEARSSTLGNVLATNTHTISIEPGAEYVVWYDSEDDCWDAPQLKVSTRDSFNDATAEGQKAVLQGGFTTSQQARDWICTAVQSKKTHAWCGFHYNIDGSYYLISIAVCDLSAIPTEN